jgi:putative transposase
MKELYSVADITKQAVHKYKLRKTHVENISKMVINECSKIRQNHKRMSCRRMFVRANTKVPIGRDIFEQIGFANGFKLQVIRSKKKTTWATKLAVFDNQLEGKTLNGINQAMQSDIFYFDVEGKAYYGISIIDVYSRRLLALHVSKTLRAEQNILALKKAMSERKGHSIQGCIFHSDRGSQYISSAQIKLLEESKMIPSMCKLPQENAYAERVQGTIKQEYIDPELLTEKNLQKKIKQIKWLYNNERPHTSLGNKTPVEFEEFINKLSPVDRMQLTVYKWSHPLLTKLPLMNKKEKSSKKEKSQHQINSI